MRDPDLDAACRDPSHRRHDRRPRGRSDDSRVRRLSGPTDCVKQSFAARVSGRQITRVAFFVDGKWRQTVSAKAGRTVFLLRVNPRVQNGGRHGITSKVRFSTTSGEKPRALRLVYQRCANTAAKPRFTG